MPDPPPRPLMTRPLKAAADPARRLQELLREEAEAGEMPPETAPPPPEPPVLAPPPAPPIPAAEVARLVVNLDGSRQEPVEYAGREALPSRSQLEQTYRAYVLRDNWTKGDAGATWTVYMKSKKR